MNLGRLLEYGDMFHTYLIELSDRWLGLSREMTLIIGHTCAIALAVYLAWKCHKIMQAWRKRRFVRDSEKIIEQQMRGGKSKAPTKLSRALRAAADEGNDDISSRYKTELAEYLETMPQMPGNKIKIKAGFALMLAESYGKHLMIDEKGELLLGQVADMLDEKSLRQVQANLERKKTRDLKLVPKTPANKTDEDEDDDEISPQVLPAPNEIATEHMSIRPAVKQHVIDEADVRLASDREAQEKREALAAKYQSPVPPQKAAEKTQPKSSPKQTADDVKGENKSEESVQVAAAPTNNTDNKTEQSASAKPKSGDTKIQPAKLSATAAESKKDAGDGVPQKKESKKVDSAVSAPSRPSVEDEEKTSAQRPVNAVSLVDGEQASGVRTNAKDMWNKTATQPTPKPTHISSAADSVSDAEESDAPQAESNSLEPIFTWKEKIMFENSLCDADRIESFLDVVVPSSLSKYEEYSSSLARFILVLLEQSSVIVAGKNVPIVFVKKPHAPETCQELLINFNFFFAVCYRLMNPVCPAAKELVSKQGKVLAVTQKTAARLLYEFNRIYSELNPNSNTSTRLFVIAENDTPYIRTATFIDGVGDERFLVQQKCVSFAKKNLLKSHKEAIDEAIVEQRENGDYRLVEKIVGSKKEIEEALREDGGAKRAEVKLDTLSLFL